MGSVKKVFYGFDQIMEEDGFSARLYIDLQNQRVKIKEYEGSVESMQASLLKLCKEHGLGKIIAVIREEARKDFTASSYLMEGVIEGYFDGAAGYCASCFTDPQRAFSSSPGKADEIIELARKQKGMYVPQEHDFEIRTAEEKDSAALAELYDKVFTTYPTPMDEAGYVRKMIQTNVLFKVAFLDGRMISAASADMNLGYFNAEITDCATLPEFRGKGLLSELIHHLEDELKERRFGALYSLSRALSHGINIVLSKHGYDYTGRLINNCHIMGSFEDMNVWVKKLKG